MTWNRRDLLSAAATAATAGAATLAGCSGGGRDEREQTGNPRIQASDRTLVGRPAEVRLAGFPPETEVALDASATDSRGVEFAASWKLRTDEAGAASLAGRVASTPTDSGKSSGWTAMGSGFDSPDAPAVEMLLQRLAPRNGSSPTPSNFVVGERDAVDVTLTASVGGERRASATATRVVTDAGVSRRTVEDSDLVAWLYEPPDARSGGGSGESGTGPAPAVVTLHGSHALVPHALSRTLASHGYATLALQYAGADGLPESVADVPVEYFRRATRWLTDREGVADGRVGYVGISRGVEAALIAGAQFEGRTTVVGYSGGGVYGPSVNAAATTVTDWASAWTEGGDPLADAAAVRTTFSAVRDAQSECETAACVPETVGEWVGEAVRERAVIPVEDVEGPILLLAGTDDATWPSAALSSLAIDRLDRRGHDAPYRLRVYEGAGHVFGLPYRDYTGDATRPKYGGSPSANAAAAANSWPVVLRYLRGGLRE
ncbi:dienelactone hydrolase family protein [Halorussus gelatinilyticus]|uniref:Dienelactone hydrolase family protein n=1 Tax=Halorussus gelatinilyticus TaxID=2937524 RepID=A0A8U0IGD2_9EURY|nr:acyl-CoA thioester hydrolase/BAAT C-terminal domain-containing protein [Halorussus gelatinilyticus]UPV99725.1 dienelactone hydrolase family protein [Halorussus gelatinilyticus]